MTVSSNAPGESTLSLSRILFDAAAFVASGWTQHAMIREVDGGSALQFCAWGAVRLASGGTVKRHVHHGPSVEPPATNRGCELSWLAADACIIALQTIYAGSDASCQTLCTWNDKPQRTPDDVSGLLRSVATVAMAVPDPIAFRPTTEWRAAFRAECERLHKAGAL